MECDRDTLISLVVGGSISCSPSTFITQEHIDAGVIEGTVT